MSEARRKQPHATHAANKGKREKKRAGGSTTEDAPATTVFVTSVVRGATERGRAASASKARPGSSTDRAATPGSAAVDLTSSAALKNPWGGAAQRYWAASRLARDLSTNRLHLIQRAWDGSRHVPVPYECRGLRPVTHSCSEPWASESMQKWAGATDSGTAVGLGFTTSGLKRLDDGQSDDIVQLFNRRRREDLQKAASRAIPPWDSTPHRYTPPALRGLKPVTREPWDRDEAVYRQLTDSMRGAREPYAGDSVTSGPRRP